MQEGAYGSDGQYAVEYFENAAPAQNQLATNDIPKVLSQSDELLLLNLQSWPSDWALGSVIVIQTEHTIQV
jgi:hypothetical protein